MKRKYEYSPERGIVVGARSSNGMKFDVSYTVLKLGDIDILKIDSPLTWGAARDLPSMMRDVGGIDDWVFPNFFALQVITQNLDPSVQNASVYWKNDVENSPSFYYGELHLSSTTQIVQVSLVRDSQYWDPTSFSREHGITGSSMATIQSAPACAVAFDSLDLLSEFTRPEEVGLTMVKTGRKSYIIRETLTKVRHVNPQLPVLSHAKYGAARQQPKLKG